MLKVRLQRNTFGDTLRGLDEEVEIQLSIDHELVTLLTVGGDYPGYDPGLVNALPDDDAEGNARHRYRLVADEHLDVRVPVKAGLRLVSAAFTDRDARMPERVPMQPMSIQSRIHLDDAGDPGIDRIEVVGPYNSTVTEDTVSRQKIFTCRPASEQDVTPCARQIVGRLATNAYRRPVSAAEVNELLGLFEGVEDRLRGFDAGSGSWSRRCFRRRRSSFGSNRIRRASRQATPTTSAIWSLRRGFRLRCGGAFPTTSSGTWRSRAVFATGRCERDRCAGCLPIRKRIAGWLTSWSSGWRCVVSMPTSRHRVASPGSMMRFARRWRPRPGSFSRARFMKIGASSICCGPTTRISTSS